MAGTSSRERRHWRQRQRRIRSSSETWCGQHVNGISIAVQTISGTTTVATDGSGSIVQGNYVGVKADGSGTLGNGSFGVTASAPATIGGTTAAARNVISGNGINGSAGGINLGIATAPTPNPTTVVFDAGGTIIQGNYIGTNPAGTAAMSNTGRGILVQAPNVVIGGTAAGAGNVISGGTNGNNTTGFGIDASASTLNGVLVRAASGLIIQGNYIGTNAAGTGSIPNASTGINVTVPTVTIGGTSPPPVTLGTTGGAGNLISGNTTGVNANGFVSSGVALALGSSVVVQGNYIGTNATGTAAIANSGSGIVISAPNGTIANNLISGNTSFGIDLPSFLSGGVKYSDASGAVIKGNVIGTSAAGASPAIPNSRGISLASPNVRVGGTAAGDRNVISGNNGLGIFVGVHFNGAVVASVGTGAVIEGNYIGTNAAGTTAIPNTSDGISATGSSTTGGTVTGLAIGGAAQGAGNPISGNGLNGIGLNTFVTERRFRAT
jgi:hypothetical protein